MAANPAVRARTPRFTLRPATAEDYDFALALFLESPRELLEPQGKWDEARFTARFQEVFEPGAAQIICANGADIGWMHVSELADRLHLHYMLIAAPFRCRGIGTALIRRLQGRACAEPKPLTLNVLRANKRAIALYGRLTFRTVGGDTERLQMRWDDGPHPALSQPRRSARAQRFRKS